MLVLSRKAGESIRIGEGVEIKVIEVAGDKVKIGIEAPSEMKILRGELYLTIEANQEAAKALTLDDLKKLLDV